MSRKLKRGRGLFSWIPHSIPQLLSPPAEVAVWPLITITGSLPGFQVPNLTIWKRSLALRNAWEGFELIVLWGVLILSSINTGLFSELHFHCFTVFTVTDPVLNLINDLTASDVTTPSYLILGNISINIQFALLIFMHRSGAVSLLVEVVHYTTSDENEKNLKQTSA